MKFFEIKVNILFVAKVIYTTLFFIIYLLTNSLQAQSACSLGDPVFVENFGSGSDRLGPSLNQDPNTNVHPNFRPAGLYTYIGSGDIGQDQYGLVKNPKHAAQSGNAGWNDSFLDHTPDNEDSGIGYMYYCDAKEDLNVFYAQKIGGLCEEIEYELSAWFAKTNAPDYFIDPNIKLIIGFTDINDQNIGSIVETDTGAIEGIGPNRWHRRSLVFTVPTGTENIYFMLKNNVAGAAGNDLAIDDIEVRPCGPNIDITNQISNSIINENDIICLTDTNNTTTEIIANTPSGFAHQWQESISNNIWTDISGETLNTLNYNIPLNSNSEHLIRLKFAHNNSNLNNSKCFFLSQEIRYSKTFSSQVNNIFECDNLDDADDFNGIIQTFNLENQTNTILSGQSATEYTVTYHLSQADADAGINSLSSPHENNASPNSQTIFTRVLNNSTGCFNTNTTFDLIVSPLPLANPVVDLELCDNLDDGDKFNGIVQSFDLESQTNTILGTQNLSDFTVTYHISQSDADTGANPLPSPHENSASPNSQTIYTRIVNNITTCVNSHLTFNLLVNALPIANLVQDLELCDDVTDGDDTNGVVQTFDLESQTSTILGTQLTSNFNVTYHLSHSDAIAGINPLSSPHENNLSPISEVIYVRILNTATGCVNTDSSFNLIVHTLPVVNIPNLYSQCDDISNDSQAFFNLTLDSIKAEINPNYLAEGLTFYYYSDSGTTNLISTPSSYQNTILGFAPETVWVKVEKTNTCSRTVPLTIQVNPYSGALALYNPTIYQCDDGTDVRDGISTFDLTNIKDHISTVIFSTFNVTVHFYESEIDAQLEINEIFDIANHQNTNSPNSQDIWVRTKSDLGNNCLGLEEFSNLLIVEALPVANPISINRQCDYDTSDSIHSYPFDTSQIEVDLLNGQNPVDVNITYTYLDNDGLTTVVSNTLPNPFLTTSQIITIRVTNYITADTDGPCYDETTLEFIVDEHPIANPITPQIFCDDGIDDGDGLHDFDTSAIHSTLLNGQSGMKIFYYDENGLELPSPLPNPFTSGTQTVLAKVINPINDMCYGSTDITLIVNPLPAFTIETPQIVCSSDPNFTIVLDPIEANITENFNYEWMFQDGTLLSNTPTLPVSTPGTYYVTLTNPITNCTKTKDIFVNASELATITLDDVTIVDVSENNSVTINHANLGLGDYEFALKEADDFFIVYQDDPFFDNIKAGFHTIFVRDKNGCGTSSLDISVIGYPKFFTPNSDGSNDVWQIKGVSAQFQPNSSIYIFDRYGKLLKQISPASPGWDGTFNNELLNTDDYWFKVFLQDGRQLMGHFTLKR